MSTTKPNKKKTSTKPTPSQTVDQVINSSTSLQQIANTLGFLALRTSDYKNKSDTEQIIFLANLGFGRNSIAAIVGTTPSTVSVRLSEAKSQQTKKPD
jgi:hypothetical protein